MDKVRTRCTSSTKLHPQSKAGIEMGLRSIDTQDEPKKGKVKCPYVRDQKGNKNAHQPTPSTTNNNRRRKLTNQLNNRQIVP